RATGRELLPQLEVVLDDAVVDDADRPDLVRVRVLVARPAVGRPPRVADADGARRRLLLQLLFEVRELAATADDARRSVVIDGDAGRVVAAILELAKAADEE